MINKVHDWSSGSDKKNTNQSEANLITVFGLFFGIRVNTLASVDRDRTKWLPFKFDLEIMLTKKQTHYHRVKADDIDIHS